MDREDCEIVLANRAFVYALLARAFVEEADTVFLSVLVSDHCRDEFDLIDDANSVAIMASFGNVVRLAQRAIDRGQSGISELNEQYVALFAGLDAFSISPWETTYTRGNRALFQSDMLVIRDVYRNAGFLSASYPHVADDFIGLELDFLAKLAEEVRAMFGQGDADSCGVRLGQASAFLEEHLLRWIDSLARAIESVYPDSFYAAFAQLTASWAKRDQIITSDVLRVMRTYL